LKGELQIGLAHDLAKERHICIFIDSCEQWGSALRSVSESAFQAWLAATLFLI
jgi:hypothetical protein